MTFAKEALLDKLGTRDEVSDEVYDDSGRWSVIHEFIFLHEEKTYRTYFTMGATDQQDHAPFEYEDDEIECPEVHQVPTTVLTWEEVASV